MPTATQDSWTTHPLPEQHTRLMADWTFSPEEYRQLQQGLIPQEMEDKWFIYHQEDVLYFHRSWTGFCIFQVHFREVEAGYQVSQILVSRDSEQYRVSNDQDDLALLRYLIEALLLGLEVPYPLPGGLQGPVQAALSRRHQVGRTRGEQQDSSPPESARRRVRP
jgi:hypothetical protein